MTRADPTPVDRRAGCTARTAVPMAALVCAAAALLTACGPAPDPRPEPTASAAIVEDSAPAAAPVPHESELAPGFDSPPDTAAVPDASLTADELTALLRVPATAALRPETCAADGVDIELWGYDVAAGSRFSTLRVTNTSAEPCSVAGFPGVGARGEWGSGFLILAEQDPIDSGDGSPVTLAPGAAASAPIRWTGALAGAHDERISLLVVQLAQGQEPLRVAPTISAESMMGGDSGEPHEATMDVGMLTTVRVGSFSAA
ncbi:DUF4232 domain-containing protein [Agrococcus beijingensis]|uniref:DUF4232 domain-containing protein n=1 Tax=Agrococcus beijingensis TaxID=3068634 RepID=UPI00274189DF|nr:DUF4232 domain-containing protein [Agrococcus sp. REN33]